jgi:hypothetical protein
LNDLVACYVEVIVEADKAVVDYRQVYQQCEEQEHQAAEPVMHQISVDRCWEESIGKGLAVASNVASTTQSNHFQEALRLKPAHANA